MVKSASPNSTFNKIDPVDFILDGQDGKIPRTNSNCSHSKRHSCANCLPIDPYDAEYLKEKDIKHMSLHAYIRSKTDGHGKSTKSLHVLETINCKLLPNCDSGHRPYPNGICTKCRPQTVSLNRQVYRNVDNISIENDTVANKFLDSWRRDGNQRVGYLIGVYEVFPDVPLGIKGRVCAIYEPPQTSGPDFVKFEEDPNEEAVDKLCGLMSMKRIGWVVTDLFTKDAANGQVHCVRHPESFLMTAKECITAGHFQNKYKNVSKYTEEGYFGSKFVTLVVSGDQANQIHFSGYQVSEQCTAMVDADIICPTNYPELASVRTAEPNSKQFITDVQFIEKNEYGVQVHRDAKPMPVEFLLVDVPAGKPKVPESTFHVLGEDSVPFPIENRTQHLEPQDLTSVWKYIKQFREEELVEMTSNFHFLLWLLTNKIVTFTPEEIEPLVSALTKMDGTSILKWYKSNSNWNTLIGLCQVHEAHPEQPSTPLKTSDNAGCWACNFCTFQNIAKDTDCAMCNLPKS
uniref:MPN domain-containing protein n=1 Tax=Rhabditophanes sp. KR3021 TaxID=114890 RepID=A0AC35TYX7_9BILA